MSLTSQALVRIIGDDSHASATLKKFSAEAELARRNFDRDFGGIARIARTAFTAAGVAAAGAGLAIGKSVHSAAEADKTWNLLRAQLEQSGVAFNVVRGEIRSAADELQSMTRFGDEETAATLQRLVQITGDYRGSLANVELAMDVAVGAQKSLEESARLVGRAMLGLTGEFKEQGIVIREGETGIEALRRMFDGLAREDGKTLEAQLVRIANATDDVFQAFGRAVAGDDAARSIGGVADAISELAAVIDANAQKIHGFIEDFVDGARIAGAFVQDGPVAGVRKALEVRGERRDERISDMRREDFGDAAILRAAGLTPASAVPPRPKPPATDWDADLARLRGGLTNVGVIDPQSPDQILRRFFKESELAGGSARAIGGLGSAWGDVQRRNQREREASVDRFRDAESAGERELQEDLDRWQGLIGRGVDTFTDSLIHAAGSADSLSDALGSMLRAIAQAAGSELLGMGLQGVVGWATAGRARGVAEATGDAAGVAAATTAAGAGPLSLGLLAGGLLLGIGTQLFGDRGERKQDQYEATLRALKESRKTEFNLTLVFPRGTPNPLDMQWLESLSTSIDGIAGADMGKTKLEYRDF